jgi:hypothetical protein
MRLVALDYSAPALREIMRYDFREPWHHSSGQAAGPIAPRGKVNVMVQARDKVDMANRICAFSKGVLKV